jgi:hypothetical protein
MYNYFNMLNIKYLCSGLQNSKSKLFLSTPIESKKLNYYRLSDGFRDANNSYEKYISKIV